MGTLRGGRGSVSRRGRLRVQRYVSRLSGVTSAGPGIDVALRGTRLRKPLTLSQAATRRPAGAIPVIAHRRADGTWELKRARVDRRGRIVVTTRTFSLNLPSWFNPRAWLEAAGNFIARKAGGRTSPVTCPSPAPSWFSVDNRTVTVHACGEDNPDSGGERAEVRIKNNRGAVQQVTMAGNRDYVYVEGQPDVLRAAVGALTGTNPATTVFLSPGDSGYMTVGHRRPAADVSYTTLVETTYRSLFLNFSYYAIDLLVDDVGDRVKFVAAVKLAQDCLGVYDLEGGTVKDPKTALSAESFADVFTCVLRKGGEQLADPKKAFGAALQLTDGKIAGYTTQQLTEELTRVGSRLQQAGRAFKVLNFVPVLQQVLQGPVDVLGALLTEGDSTHVDVRMTGRTRTTTTGSGGTTGGVGGGAGRPDGSGGTTGSGSGSSSSGSGTSQPPATRQIVVDNRVTNGGSQMREDTAAYLSTVMQNFCKRDGCALPGTDMGSGAVITAECTAFGHRTTNGQDNSSIDDGNPGLYSSTRWYGIRWGDGRFGYISEVWIRGDFRGGLSLRAC